jgi:hypothetical protein
LTAHPPNPDGPDPCAIPEKGVKKLLEFPFRFWWPSPPLLTAHPPNPDGPYPCTIPEKGVKKLLAFRGKEKQFRKFLLDEL